jgi:hypothetical protein
MSPLLRLCLSFVLLGVGSLAAEATGIKPGEVTAFTVPLTGLQQRFIGAAQSAGLDRALCVVAVPANFDPAKTWPVLIVSAPSDAGYNSSRIWLRDLYAGTALAAGWIVIAADPPVLQSPETDTPELRYTLAVAALEELEKQWRGIRDWPIAFGGFSGGAAHSVFLAALFAKAGRPGVGLFLGGCNADVSEDALNRFAPPRRVFRAMPVFLSGGNTDTFATPIEQARVEASLRDNGFTRIRRESFAGGHVFHAPHLAAALKWIDGVRAGAPSKRVR